MEAEGLGRGAGGNGLVAAVLTTPATASGVAGRRGRHGRLAARSAGEVAAVATVDEIERRQRLQAQEEEYSRGGASIYEEELGTWPIWPESVARERGCRRRGRARGGLGFLGRGLGGGRRLR